MTVAAFPTLLSWNSTFEDPSIVKIQGNDASEHAQFHHSFHLALSPPPVTKTDFPMQSKMPRNSDHVTWLLTIMFSTNYMTTTHCKSNLGKAKYSLVIYVYIWVHRNHFWCLNRFLNIIEIISSAQGMLYQHVLITMLRSSLIKEFCDFHNALMIICHFLLFLSFFFLFTGKLILQSTTIHEFVVLTNIFLCESFWSGILIWSVAGQWIVACTSLILFLKVF